MIAVPLGTTTPTVTAMIVCRTVVTSTAAVTTVAMLSRVMLLLLMAGCHTMMILSMLRSLRY